MEFLVAAMDCPQLLFLPENRILDVQERLLHAQILLFEENCYSKRLLVWRSNYFNLQNISSGVLMTGKRILHTLWALWNTLHLSWYGVCYSAAIGRGWLCFLLIERNHECRPVHHCSRRPSSEYDEHPRCTTFMQDSVPYHKDKKVMKWIAGKK